MYDDSYSLFFDNKAVGQSTPIGGSMEGRFPFETPFNSRSPFENRAVGQHTMPLSESLMFNEFNVERKPAFTSGWTTKPEPRDNPVVPTLIYSTNDTQTPNDVGMPYGIKMRHILILAVAALIALIVILK